jgi:DNA-binding LacI/PurR family transcriptional regulator
MRSTMQDVARECGLSMMTVSRVLRGQGYVSAATRERVVEAAKRLDYELNVLAQNFARRRSGLVGIAAPFAGLIGSHYFGEIIRGFQRAFEDSEWNLVLFDILSPSFDDGKKLAGLFRTRKVDGLLVVAPGAKDKFLDTFSDLQFPLVVVGKKVTNAKVCCVSCDDRHGIELACAHLHALGHRKIAFVGGPLGFSVAQERERGYQEFSRAKKLPIPPEFLQRGDYSMLSGRRAGEALLNGKRRPTAILAANDMMAFGVMESARELGVSIPDELSVAGFDDLPTAAERFPSLTTVHQPVVEMAEQGASLLRSWMENDHTPKRKIVVPVSLVTRESTAKR